MPPVKRKTNTKRKVRLNPARQRAVAKVKKIITEAKKNETYFSNKEKTTRIYDPAEAAEFRVLSAEAHSKAKKGKALLQKIKKGQKKPLSTKSPIKALTPRAKPWVEYIIKDRNTASQLLSIGERRAFEKMAAGKKVTRAEMNDIISGVREFRTVFPGRHPPSLRQKQR